MRGTITGHRPAGSQLSFPHVPVVAARIGPPRVRTSNCVGRRLGHAGLRGAGGRRRVAVPEPYPPPDGRGQARRRGLLLPGWEGDGLPVRAGTGEPLLPDLPAVHGNGGRAPGLAGSRQDHLCLHLRQERGHPVRLDPPRPAFARAAAGGDRVPGERPGAPLRVGLRRPHGRLRGTALGRRTRPPHRRARLRRRGKLVAGRRVDRLHLDAGHVRGRPLGARDPAYRNRSVVLRRNLDHARRRQRTAAPDPRARLRRRPVLLPRRVADHLAALLGGRPGRGHLVDEPGRERPAPAHRLRGHELGALRPSLPRVRPVRLEQAGIQQLRGVPGGRRRREGAGPDHHHGRLRRAAGPHPRRNGPRLDLHPPRRGGRPDLPRRLGSRGRARRAPRRADPGTSPRRRPNEPPPDPDRGQPFACAVPDAPRRGPDPRGAPGRRPRAHRTGHRGPRGGHAGSRYRAALPDLRARGRRRPAASRPGRPRDPLPFHLRSGGSGVLAPRRGTQALRERPGEGVRVLGNRRGAGRALFRGLRHPGSGKRRGHLRQLRRPRGPRQGGGRPPLLPG